MDSNSLLFQGTRIEVETDTTKKTEKEIATEEDTIEIENIEIVIEITEIGIEIEIFVIETSDQEVLMILTGENSLGDKVFYILIISCIS